MKFDIDTEYEHKVADAVMKAIAGASMVESQDGKKIAYMRSGEIVSALLTNIAFQMATSKATETRTKTREAIDKLSKRLRSRIEAARQAIESGAAGDIVVIHEGDQQ